MKLIFLMIVIPLLAGCAIGEKSWGSAQAADAFEITTPQFESGETSTKLTAGGGASAVAFQKAYKKEDSVTYPTIMVFSKRKSLWGLFSGTDTGNIAMVYIAGSNETPEQTLKNLEKLERIVNPKKEQ